MNNYTERDYIISTDDYNRNFWNYVRGNRGVADALSKGIDNASVGFYLPTVSDNKLEKAISKESVFRSLATVVHAYSGVPRIFAYGNEDLASWVPEGNPIPVQDATDDFTRYEVGSHKLAVITKLDNDFARDAAFDVEDYFTKRLARNFAYAEDAAFINGNGESEPMGLLDEDNGAQVLISTTDLSFSDVLNLFFAVKPEYRKNAVWIMNDDTALKLRLLQDENGNYLWNHANDTIMGKPVVISNDMPNAESGKIPILFGDFSYYWIICRSPVSVRMLKEKYALMDQAGFLATEFMDGKLICREAIQGIDIS